MSQDVRYDRQIRLWGEEGQRAIQGTSVCLIGAGALGTEIAKSLVLAGVGSVCIVDKAVVTASDLGNNFFLQVSATRVCKPGFQANDIDKSRGEAALRHLNELNPTVTGAFEALSPEELAQSDEKLAALLNFSVVVASNISSEPALAISEYLFKNGVPFIYARSFGFVGYIRVCVREHAIINTHEENPRPDLRLDRPFSALRQFQSAVKLESLTPEHHRHVPYVLLYLHALDKYKLFKGDPHAFPVTSAQRKELLSILLQMRMPNESGSLDEENFREAQDGLNWQVAPTKIPSEIQELFADPQCSTQATPFWQIIAALKRFSEDLEDGEGESNGANGDGRRRRDCLPLQGNLPDMTSYSEAYTTLAKMFHEKAVKDADLVFSYMSESASVRGQPLAVTKEQVILFCSSNFLKVYNICKTASQMRVQRGSSLLEEFGGAIEEVLADLRQENEILANTEPEEKPAIPRVPLAVWYLLLRAVDRFKAEKSRYPGTNGIPCTIDAMDLKKRLDAVLGETGAADAQELANSIPSAALDEMCRYGAAELHVVAALLGGITAQEIIKLATGQYLPVHNTLVFDGHSQMSTTYKL